MNEESFSLKKCYIKCLILSIFSKYNNANLYRSNCHMPIIFTVKPPTKNPVSKILIDKPRAKKRPTALPTDKPKTERPDSPIPTENPATKKPDRGLYVEV